MPGCNALARSATCRLHRALPSARTVPAGPQWAHEIKHDGYRFICRRDGDRVRVYSRALRHWKRLMHF